MIWRPAGWLAFLLPICLSPGCRDHRPANQPVGGVASPVRFRRVTDRAHIAFRHENGETGKKWFPEWLGAGCALIDYDHDGWQDVFLVNGGPLPGWKGAEAPRDRLYRNQQDGTFEDVTDRAGLKTRHYGIGCCAGDYDNDGNLDLYVTGFGKNVLYRNRGDGTFADVTAEAGVAAGGLCTGCAFGDYDRDGNLDLYVCRYVKYSLQSDVPCYVPRGAHRFRTICRQTTYPPAPHLLFHNNGRGRFTDATAAVFGVPPLGRGLGVLFANLEGAETQDLCVANDLNPNFLFRAAGAGRMQEDGLRRGIAFNLAGSPQAGMGIATADINGDGLPDLALSHFSGEYTTLYQQDERHQFQDVSARIGLVESTSPYVGFGIGLQDFDRDGWPDLFQVNGGVTDPPSDSGAPPDLSEAKVVLRNDAGRRFIPVANPWADSETARARVGRGAAFGDVENRGLVDALVSNLRDAPDLLRNESPPGNHWLRVVLECSGKNRYAIGARVTVQAAGHSQVQFVQSGGSYCSQNDFRLLFGLGSATAADRLEVIWPDGKRTHQERVPGDRELRIMKKEGTKR